MTPTPEEIRELVKEALSAPPTGVWPTRYALARALESVEAERARLAEENGALLQMSMPDDGPLETWQQRAEQAESRYQRLREKAKAFFADEAPISYHDPAFSALLRALRAELEDPKSPQASS